MMGIKLTEFVELILIGCAVILVIYGFIEVYKYAKVEKESKESKEEEYENKFPDFDFRHYKNPEQMLKEDKLYESEAKKNYLQNNWVNKVLNDGVLGIFKYNYLDGKTYEYNIITEHYIMSYWHNNIPCAFGQSVSIYQRRKEGDKELIGWKNGYLTSKTKLHLYYIEENLRKFKYHGEIPNVNDFSTMEANGYYHYTKEYSKVIEM